MPLNDAPDAFDTSSFYAQTCLRLPCALRCARGYVVLAGAWLVRLSTPIMRIRQRVPGGGFCGISGFGIGLEGLLPFPLICGRLAVFSP